jgi:acyl phosphate:glycerol-3-phosphate acyltransferase
VHPAFGALIAYAMGSIPAAYLAGRAKGIDLRTHGSGNLGATNVVRVLGAKIGLCVFAFDMAKGALAVALLPRYTATTLDPSLLQFLYGAAAIIGHARPVWLGFGKGGKGVATACGVFLAISFVPALCALAVFGTALVASGFVSLGSMAGAAALPVVVGADLGVGSPVFAASLVVTAFVFWTHRPNIARLRRGEEHHFSRLGSIGIGASSALAAAVMLIAALCIRWRAG